MALPGYTCTTCGRPVTTLARDVYEVEPDSSTKIERYRVGDIKAGCDLHPVESVYHPRAVG